MSDYHVSLSWVRTTPDFSYDTYSRSHELRTGSGVNIPASSAPDFLGATDRVNPEEALVAALSSCHMLTFLAVAARKKFVVDRYEDEAEGTLAKNAEGRLAITHITLRPKVVFSGTTPTAEELQKLHEAAHRGCFIAASIRSEVTMEPRS